MSAGAPGGTSWLCYYGEELRATRELAGMGVRELASYTSYSFQQLSNVETGRRTPSEAFSKEVDAALKTGDRFQRILYRVLEDQFPAWYGGAAREEQRATRIRTYQAQAVPGLFQTEAYARALMKSARPRIAQDRLDAEVAGRLGRQTILTKDNPPLIWAIVDESALQRPIGGRKVISEQLERLAEIAETPNVVVQVVPLRTANHAGLDGSFNLWSYADRDDVLYVEGMLFGQIMEGRDDVAAAHLAYDLLLAVTLDPGASVDLIRAAARDYREMISSLKGATWRKSSYSGGQGGDCVEVADGFTGVVPVRDSKDPQGPALAFASDAWSAFVADVKAGRFPV